MPTRRAHGSEWRDRRRESAEAGSSNRGIHPRHAREDAAISPVSERARVQAADRQAGALQGSPRMGGQSCRHETSAQGRAPEGRARLQAATCSQRVQLRIGAQSVDQPWHTDKSFLDRLAADVLQASGAEGERAETCGERQNTGVDVRGAPCRLQTTGTKHGVANTHRAVPDAGQRARHAGKQRHRQFGGGQGPSPPGQNAATRRQQECRWQGLRDCHSRARVSRNREESKARRMEDDDGRLSSTPSCAPSPTRASDRHARRLATAQKARDRVVRHDKGEGRFARKRTSRSWSKQPRRVSGRVEPGEERRS